jgi:hypothetical protein
MRNGQNKRMRGRNRKGQNPLTRVYESNGPDVKIRGTASHIADKYVQLARDAQASGDPVGAENYFQHAEHYFRLIAAAQEQFRQANPYYRPEQETRDDFGDDTDDETSEQPAVAAGEQPFGTGEPQPYLPREAQPFQPRESQPYGREHRSHGGRGQQAGSDQQSPDLPAFITGGGQPQSQGESYQGFRQPNGFDGGGQGDRFPLHRRRRRHRGPRGDQPGSSQSMGSESSDEPGPPAGE